MLCSSLDIAKTVMGMLNLQLPVNNWYVDDLNIHYSGYRQTTLLV